MPYTPTWQNPYLPINGPSSAMGQSVIPAQQAQNMTGWQQPMQQTMQQYATPQQYGQTYPQPKVDGPSEAMSRFLMRYPENMLVPGFTTPDPLFDVNGKNFYALSIEMDGRRNLEVFDYFPHAQMQRVTVNGATFDSQQDYDDFLAKVAAVIGEINGVHEPVRTDAAPAYPSPVPSGPAAAATANAPTAPTAGV